MARKQQVQRWAAYCRQRKQAERQRRVELIAEFDAGDPEATLHALAAEILEYRRAMRLLREAVGWADLGAPFSLISPGPYWQPRRPIERAVAAQSSTAPRDDESNAA
jgi:hypothetical protein